MSSYLDKILESVRAKLSEQRPPLRELEEKARAQEPPRDFAAALAGDDISLIAEIKRRSPSAGEISLGADPAVIAKAFEAGGASALSVLTEPDFFSGSLNDLAAARNSCSLPTLRKDFIIDSVQVVEARAAGADAILLIVAALSITHLEELLLLASEWGMGALVEAHDEREIDLALGGGASIVGINQRDLGTFQVDRQLAALLRARIPKEILVVAESGISSPADVEKLRAAEVDAVLVGESLMRQADPARAVAELLGKAEPGAPLS